VPWQYGFASIRSIVRFTFTEARPPTFHGSIQPAENGFRANVDPEVPHPRPSQASERVLGTGDRVLAQLLDGDAELVAHPYQDPRASVGAPEPLTRPGACRNSEAGAYRGGRRWQRRWPASFRR
jgi:hypothetical protein